jgi:hypothetical protein
MPLIKMKRLIKKLTKILYGEPSGLTPLTKAEYDRDLVDIPEEKAKKAFELAWATRNFEIELYWKRANYFWAFIASTFVGYFALVNAANYVTKDKFDHVEVYFIICIGFTLSIAWISTNKGSKSWQRNWEAHVDLLEDKFTGPLYKTVYSTKTYSVSKINEIVSFMFAFVWLLLGVKYLFDQNLVNFSFGEINWFVTCSTLGVAFAVLVMVFGHGRGNFGTRQYKMYRRNITYL